MTDGVQIAIASDWMSGVRFKPMKTINVRILRFYWMEFCKHDLMLPGENSLKDIQSLSVLTNIVTIFTENSKK